MKTLNKISILSVAFIFAIFTSCENEDYLVFTAQEPSDAVTLSMNIQTSYLVSEQTASNLAERIIWSEPDFGAPTPNVYVVEMSLNSDFSTIDLSYDTTDTIEEFTVEMQVHYWEAFRGSSPSANGEDIQ